MPTTALPRGRQSKTRLAFEATYGVNPAASFSELNIYTGGFNRTRPIVADDVLGAGFANNVDARPAAPTVEDAVAKFSVPLDLAQIGFWLGAALGRVTATGTTPKTHSFTSGVTPIPSLYLERELVAAAQYEAMRGSVVKTLKLPFGPSAGYQMVDIELMGAQILEPYASTGAGTPTVEALASRVPKSVGIIKLAGTQIGSVISGDITLSNVLTADRYVGDAAFPSLMALEEQTCAVNLNARYNTDVLRAYGALGANTLPSLVSVEVDYVLSASLSLAIVLANVRFEPVDITTTNGKTMSLALKGGAEVGASAAMLTATLINAHATY